MNRTKIVKLASYYKSAIYANKGNVQDIKKEILATLYHSTSTDKNLIHDYCPIGPDSWCFFQKAATEKRLPGKHVDNVSKTLKSKFLPNLLPIYLRLSNEELLKRCCACRTQNANESLHHIIWNKCPEEKIESKRQVETAAIIAMTEFNFGCPKTIVALHKELGLDLSITTAKITQQRDARSLQQNDYKNSLEYKKTEIQRSKKSKKDSSSYGAVQF